MCVRVNVPFLNVSYVRKTNDFRIKSVCATHSNHAMSAATIDTFRRKEYVFIYLLH